MTMTDPLAAVPKDRLPRHVAVIMDGNGRWAQIRGMPRNLGHKQGVEATRRLVRTAHEIDLEALTIFGFSTENWSRPAEEVSLLKALLKAYFTAEISELHKAGIRIRVIGRKDDFSPDIKSLLDQAEAVTAANTGMTLCVALSYGGRQEIMDGVKALAAEVATGTLQPEDISAGHLEGALESADLPSLDLIIRTSGEQRLSNFLLWQAAYAELYFDPVLWPDYSAKHFSAALLAFANRKRRFGGLQAQSAR